MFKKMYSNRIKSILNLIFKIINIIVVKLYMKIIELVSRLFVKIRGDVRVFIKYGFFINFFFRIIIY